MTGKYFVPEQGKKYLNLNGLYYNCIGHDEEGRPWMQSDNKDKWTFVACGCRQYAGGQIDWEHSIKGHFEKEANMSKGKFYKFTFADGFVCWQRGFSAQELRVMESKHGKLVKKEVA